MRPFKTRSSLHGLSLLELSISLAISSALVILTMRKMSADLHLEHLQNESKWVVGVLGDIQTELGSSRNYSSLSDLTLGRLTSVPKNYIDKTSPGVTTVINGFSGRVRVGPLSLGGENNAYALNYTSVSRDACVKLIALIYNNAKNGVSLYAIVGSVGVTTAIPTIELVGGAVVAPGHKILQTSDDTGLDMLAVGNFCDSVGTSGDPLRSLTLIRRP